MNKFLLKVMAIVIALASCFCLYSCKGSSVDSDTDAPDTDVTENDVDESVTDVTDETTDEGESGEYYTMLDYMALELSDYITLGQYKGIEVSLPEIVVTETEIDEEIQAIVDSYTTYEAYDEVVTDRATVRGDYVNINFVGTMDGEIFEGGSAENVDLVLAENNGFIDWFEDELYGVMPGTTVISTGNFPEDYYEDIAGKEVTFEITVNHIVGHYEIPEFNDEFIATYTELDSVEAFRDVVRFTLQVQKESEREGEKYNLVWQAVIDCSEIVEYPQDQVMYYYTSERSYIESYATSYGYSYEDMLAMIGATDAEIMEYAESRVKEELVFYQIVKTEGIEVSEEDYAVGLAQYSEAMGVTGEELEAQYGKDYIKESILWDSVTAYIASQVTFVEK